MFDFTTLSLPVRRDLVEAFRQVWARLAAPGTWWTGEQRVAIATVARAAYSGDEPAQSLLPEPAIAASKLLSMRPSAVTREHIQQWEKEGLDGYQYVELVAVVSQLTAVDTFHRALELELEPLPEPIAGEPSRQLPDTPAKISKAWVPTVGPPTIPTALSAVPAESAALEALHGPAYLRYEEMNDPAIARGLTRAQMELVAARTSAINECFY